MAKTHKKYTDASENVQINWTRWDELQNLCPNFGHAKRLAFYNQIILFINAGIDNAELMYVVPKGSRRILVGELAKDKNSIGKKQFDYVLM